METSQPTPSGGTSAPRQEHALSNKHANASVSTWNVLPGDAVCNRTSRADTTTDSSFPGPYWHGNEQSVRTLNVLHFTYRQFGYEFRPQKIDKVFFEWIGATNRLPRWMKWKTSNMLCRVVQSLDLVADPFGDEEWPKMFDSYRSMTARGLLKEDSTFHRNRQAHGGKSRYASFVFSLYQSKAAALPAMKWEKEKAIRETVDRLTTDKTIEGNLMTPHAVLTPESAFTAIDRALDEFIPRRRERTKRMRLPGSGACNEEKRAEGGALSALIAQKMGCPFRPYTFLDSFYEGPNGAVPITRNYTLDDLEWALDEVRKEAYACTSVHASPVALPEPYKVRVITKGDMAPYALARTWQPELWRALVEHPTFRLIGEKLTPAVVQSFCAEHAPDDRMWISGDYKQATDHIPSEISNYILEGMCRRLGVPAEDTQVLLRCLTGHTFDKVVTDPSTNTWWEETVPQRSGQLMGSPVSFPVLCVWNFVLTRLALENSHEESRRIDASEILVNGDDLLFRGDWADYLTWKAVVRWGGLLPSEGKTLVSRDFLTMNSQLYRVKPVVSRRCGTSFFVPTPLPHVQLQLAIGSMKSGHADLGSGKDHKDPLSPVKRSQMWHDFMDSCRHKSRGWNFLWRSQAGYLMSLVKSFPESALCLPLEAGGMGFPLPPPSNPFYDLRLPRTRSLTLARMLLEQGTPSQGRLRARWIHALSLDDDSPSSGIIFGEVARAQELTGCPLRRVPVETEEPRPPDHLRVSYADSPLRFSDTDSRSVRKAVFRHLRNELRAYTRSGRGPLDLESVLGFLTGERWCRTYGRFSSRSEF